MRRVCFSLKNKCLNVLFFAWLFVPVSLNYAQTIDRETNLRSLIAAEESFSRTSMEKGTREAFVTFLAEDGMIFNPSPSNGKKVWLAREKAPGVLTWTPVFADLASDASLGFTTGPYEFRRNGGEAPIGFGYYMSIWRKETDGSWKVLLDIGTRSLQPNALPALEFAAPIAQKNFKYQESITQLENADNQLTSVLAEGKSLADLRSLVGDYFRLHRMNAPPFTEKEAALADLQKYSGKIRFQTEQINAAQSGDFGYSYGTYAVKDNFDTSQEKFAESGGFAGIWRRNAQGKWTLTLFVIHAAPSGKRAEQQ